MVELSQIDKLEVMDLQAKEKVKPKVLVHPSTATLESVTEQWVAQLSYIRDNSGLQIKKFEGDWVENSDRPYSFETHVIALSVKNKIEGMMLISAKTPNSSEHGWEKEHIEMELVETAPTNNKRYMASLNRTCQYAWIGTCLVTVACVFSYLRGEGGRLYLKSVSTAVDFYSSIGFTSIRLDEQGLTHMLLDPSKAEARIMEAI